MGSKKAAYTKQRMDAMNKLEGSTKAPSRQTDMKSAKTVSSVYQKLRGGKDTPNQDKYASNEMQKGRSKKKAGLGGHKGY